MTLLLPEVEYIPQNEGIFKHIEKCARTCYKSEAKCDGTNSGAKEFVFRMITSKHLAMLEHGTVYLEILSDYSNRDYLELESKYISNPYSFVEFKGGIMCITTNYRVIVENNWSDDLEYLCPPNEYSQRRLTFRFICSRAIAQELTRHRKFSFAMESQRYCGYDKDKFGKELNFITPTWYINNKYDSFKMNAFDKCLENIEKLYMFYRECGMQPQEARVILPNCTKTELIMTGFTFDWDHFMNLRYYESTGKVDPDMKYLMELFKPIYDDTKGKINESCYNGSKD